MLSRLFPCLFLITVVCASLSAHAASAPQIIDYGKFYAGLGAGIVIPQDTSVTVSGSVTGSGNLSYKPGAGVTGMAGYHINKYITGEAELAYSSFDYDSLTGTLAGATGSIGVNGHIDAFVGLVNAIITPLGTEGISPYVGGGLGFANTNSTVNSETINGSLVPVNSSNSETDLALDAIVGVNVPVSDHFSLGGRYQYLWVDSSSTSSGGGVTTTSGSFGAHVLTAQATYNF